MFVEIGPFDGIAVAEQAPISALFRHKAINLSHDFYFEHQA